MPACRIARAFATKENHARDPLEFPVLAPKSNVRTETETFSICDANLALERFSGGNVGGATVLAPDW
jgi:hypothetical protein